MTLQFEVTITNEQLADRLGRSMCPSDLGCKGMDACKYVSNGIHVKCVDCWKKVFEEVDANE